MNVGYSRLPLNHNTPQNVVWNPWSSIDNLHQPASATCFKLNPPKAQEMEGKITWVDPEAEGGGPAPPALACHYVSC